MKRSLSNSGTCGGLFVAAALAGCSATPDLFVHRTVGPAPGEPAGTDGQGRLRVYSARCPSALDVSVETFFAPADAGLNDLLYLPAHRNYFVQTAGGAPCRYVENATDARDATPTDVALPAGRYLVSAPAEWGSGHAGPVTVPVAIEAGRTTIVHLETGWHPAGGDAPGTDLVRGSDGRVVGWSARADQTAVPGNPSTTR